MATAISTSARRLFITVVLATHAALIAWSATRHSPTYDEVAWLPAGLSHWELGRFELARVNPPLARMVAALPVILVPHEVDWTRYSVFPGARPEFGVGIDFMRANGSRSFWLFTLARWACIPFSLLGACVCYRWASDLYGGWAGCFSMALWCFCPNVLAHAELVTADVAATALGCAACYSFWLWLRRPALDSGWACGLALGLAELTKTTWLLLFALFPALWLCSRCDAESCRCAPSRPWHVGGLAVVFGIAVLVMNLGYGFEGTFTPLGEFQFVSRALTRDAALPATTRTNHFRDVWLGKLPVPLPESYVLGIDQTKAEFERGKRSYLRGEWKHGGWWYYYLYALAVKVPLGTWLLAFIAFAATVYWSDFRRRWRDEVVLLAPAACMMALVSSQTGFNAHLRYVLPAFPFVFIWLGKLFASPLKSAVPVRRALPWAAGAALICSTLSCLTIYPHCLAFFNFVGGGPLHGHAHLVDSNIDWGQDLLYLHRWLDQHPEARPLSLAYFGLTDPALVGIEFTLPPALASRWPGSRDSTDVGPRPGWHAVSANFLRGYEIPAFDGAGRQVGIGGDDFTYFRSLEPVAIAGRSIYIYHVTPAAANRLRGQLGLPSLAPL